MVKFRKIRQILIISLPNSSRRPEISALMKKHGLHFQFMDGVLVNNDSDLYHLQSTEFDTENKQSPFLPYRPGDLGCSLAYLKCFKFIMNHKFEYTMILEDDIEISENGLKNLASSEFNYCNHELMFIHDMEHYGTQGQIVSLNGAKKLWNQRLKIMTDGTPIDHLIWGSHLDLKWSSCKYSKLPWVVKHKHNYNDMKCSERLKFNDKSVQIIHNSEIQKEEREKLIRRRQEYIDKGEPEIWKMGFKINSEHKEDGIIYYIFSLIGTSNKKCVEFYADYCPNIKNLIIHHGFSGCLITWNDMNEFQGYPVVVSHNKITCENVHEVIHKQYHGDIDLLSIDIDGNDYWVLKTIIEKGILSPRVIVVEYQDIIGWEQALTIPYNPDHNSFDYNTDGGPNYCGASLLAFVKLLSNYKFVGSCDQGYNAFFIRNDAFVPEIREVTDIQECFKIPKVVDGMKDRWPKVSGLEWINV